MSKQTLNAKVRTASGKTAAKRLRQQDLENNHSNNFHQSCSRWQGTSGLD